MATMKQRRAAPAITQLDPKVADERLAGWRWQRQGGENGAPEEFRLIAPDGWQTKFYAKDTKAIAEALRRVRSQPQPHEPSLTSAEQDQLFLLGWRPAGGGKREDGRFYVRARALDDTIVERTRAEWRAAIAEHEPAPAPPVPDDLSGWCWEASERGIRLAMPTEGTGTPWRPTAAEAIPLARDLVTTEQLVAAELAAAEPIRRGPALRLSTNTEAEHSTLPLRSIRRDGGTQARTGNNEEAVVEYMTAMQEGRWTWHDGNRLIVYHDGESYWLADGFHRTEAASRAGLLDVPCVIRAGSRRDAVLYAVGANADHGLRRTREDVRRAVRTLLLDEEWRAWSNRQIAEAARCDHKTVSRVREELETGGEIPHLTERVGADGKAYPSSLKNVQAAPGLVRSAPAPVATALTPTPTDDALTCDRCGEAGPTVRRWGVGVKASCLRCMILSGSIVTEGLSAAAIAAGYGYKYEGGAFKYLRNLVHAGWAPSDPEAERDRDFVEARREQAIAEIERIVAAQVQPPTATPAPAPAPEPDLAGEIALLIAAGVAGPAPDLLDRARGLIRQLPPEQQRPPLRMLLDAGLTLAQPLARAAGLDVQIGSDDPARLDGWDLIGNPLGPESYRGGDLAALLRRIDYLTRQRATQAATGADLPPDLDEDEEEPAELPVAADDDETAYHWAEQQLVALGDLPTALAALLAAALLPDDSDPTEQPQEELWEVATARLRERSARLRAVYRSWGL